MADIGNSLTKAFDYAHGRLLDRLVGLDDSEYFWEPVPGCWSVRRGPDGRCAMDGGTPAPEPAPVTTIAWRVGHIGIALAGFADSLFGTGTLRPEDIEFAPAAAAVPAFLQASYRPWREGIGSVGEPRWWRAIGPAFGPYAEDATADLALHVFDELVHHAAEISLLRDLYLRKDQLGR
jgi:hypothetical protein